VVKFRIIVGALFASVDDAIVATVELIEKLSHNTGIVANDGFESRSREAHRQNEWHDIAQVKIESIDLEEQNM
jgi:hypothetical protein